MPRWTPLIFLFVLNLTYGFHPHEFNSQDLKADKPEPPVRLPAGPRGLSGWDECGDRSQSGRTSGLSFLPVFPEGVVVLVKTPIPFIALTLLGLLWLVCQAPVRRDCAFLLNPYRMSSVYSPQDADAGYPFDDFLNIKPDDKIGHTLWVYNLTPENIARWRLSDMRFFYYDHVRYRWSDNR